jgi:hypothetical protein
MPKILNNDIIGCYAQTELGHGSNVRGLETTATWDPIKKEFEIHSPRLTASKWWNGSMGRTASHAVCYTRACPLYHKHGTSLNLVSNSDGVHRSSSHNCYCPGKTTRRFSPVTARRRLSCRFGTQLLINRSQGSQLATSGRNTVCTSLFSSPDAVWRTSDSLLYGRSHMQYYARRI